MRADLVNVAIPVGATAAMVVTATIRQHVKRRRGGRG